MPARIAQKTRARGVPRGPGCTSLKFMDWSTDLPVASAASGYDIDSPMGSNPYGRTGTVSAAHGAYLGGLTR